MRRLFLAVVLATITVPGCSWTMMTRPPSEAVEPTPPLQCTTSRAAPILDTVAVPLIGVPSAIFTGVAIANPVQSGNCSLFSSSSSCSLFAFGSPGWKALAITGGLVGVGLAVMEGFAAADGYRWASTCAGLKAAQLSCVSGVEASCAELRRGPAPERKPPGATCAADDECREGYVCHLGHCQAAR